MSRPDLKPCPFCGGPAERVDIDEGENAGGSCICCTRCLASGNIEFGFKENFVSNWNRRADLPPTDAQIMAHPKVMALIEAADALRKSARETHRIGAATGPHWLHLGIAAQRMEAALAAFEKP